MPLMIPGMDRYCGSRSRFPLEKDGPEKNLFF